MYTFLKIKSIFFSDSNVFRGNKESINDIAFLIDEGYLILDEIYISTKKEYLIALDSIITKEHAHDLASGGGKSHIVLKLLGKKYLNKKGICKVLYEHPFCGYYPDVLSDDKLIAVECGHTNNPEKMLIYFQQGNIKECIQIPYPNHEDKKIIGYSFTAGKQLKEFLNFLEAEKIKELKNCIKK